MKALGSLLLLAVVAIPATLSGQDTTKPKIKRSPNLITSVEIETLAPNAQTAYDAVKQLRPLWLQQRGVSSINLPTNEVQIYVNGILRGGPSTLAEIRATDVRELQRLSPGDATLRYGINHTNGAILVTLK